AWVLVGIASLVAALALARWLPRRGPAAFPSPPPTSPGPAIFLADFVGAEACASCHVAEYEMWKRSTHGRAGGPPNPGRVIAPFDGRPLRFRGAVVTPS